MVWCLLVQIPRLYDIYKAQGLVDNFEQLLDNIFTPLFEVTIDPNTHPQLHLFLKTVRPTPSNILESYIQMFSLCIPVACHVLPQEWLHLFLTLPAHTPHLLLLHKEGTVRVNIPSLTGSGCPR